MRKRLLIVWHSTTGGARQMAEAAAEGARREDGVSVLLKPATDTHPDDLLAAATAFATL